MRSKSKSVSFRLAVDLHTQLTSLGTASKLSAGEAARSIVTTRLLGAETPEAIQQSQRLTDVLVALQKHEKGFAYLLFAMLTEIGKMPADDARKIVQRFINRGEK